MAFEGQPGGGNRLLLIIHALVVLGGLGAVAIAVIFRRTIGEAAWAFGSLSGRYYTSYLIWGLPYAVVERRYAAAFLIALPTADAFLDFGFPGSGSLARIVLLVVVIAGFVRVFRHGRSHAFAR